MPNELSDLLNEVVASPLGDIIASVGAGVAEAQQALDQASVAKTLEIYREGGDELLRVLRDVGYRPTFYALPETTGEVNVSMRLSGGGVRNAGQPNLANTLRPAAAAAIAQPLAAARLRALNVAPAIRAYATPVDAGFQNRYTYDAQTSAKLTFKIVPVPPPAGMDDMRVVPNLVGRTAELSRAVMEALDMDFRFTASDGTAIDEPDPGLLVTAQSPEEDAVVLGDTVVTLTLGSEDE